ncbi:transcription initiation factor TFIID subunit 4-like [Myxocyprinus asiaticus]|uniref:transcription initiation factor TFIID subunit 4-like n=1 Tax=Myxocyprinus asiaticus TaxID=70543 RepID=UPI0022221956|nr:transcription initiation factor TFIID subunit 4-like [Myxocyprinus asiaticus]XP_051532482.1 transcription initiation factor TFIID subunit 4-like [Myxocyprinus asiaticus]XP_051532483.1 transcription initiation factor TFIID subunit 4-like [Myxocyprinus asiaticus]
MVTTLPSHGVKKGTSSVQTLNGGNAMDPHTESGTPVSSGQTSSSSADASTSVPVVNNGPGVAKGHANATVAPSPNTVIQSSYGNTQSAAPAASSSGSSGPSVTVVRPSMQTAGTGLTINGSNNNTVSATVASVATQPAPGITTTTTTAPLLMNQTPASVSSGVPSKSESPKTIIQPAAQNISPGGMTLGPQLQNPGVAKGVVFQGVARTAAPATVAAVSSPAIRTITPQVLAPRLPQSSPGQNIQNIQLPPGMVLVRSDSGQLLMIPQQMLAQMQAQSQAARPAAPTSTTPGQITTAQAPGTPLMTRQVTPTTVIKQGSPTPSSTATTTLQRPPVQQASSLGAVLSVQAATTQRTVTAATGTTVSSATETMENVKKCRNFLSTLIKLATSGKQSSETVANVKELVKNLLEGTIEAEEFTSRLYKELNSSPQPYLVPFLKRSLPALRQLTPDSTAFIQQSQTLQAPAVVLTSTNTAAATATATRTLIQPALSNSSQTASLVLQPPQQGAIGKPPQVTLTTTPMVTLRGQPPGHIVMGQPQVQLKQIHTVAVKQGVVSSTRLAPGSVSVALAQKSKAKDAAGGTFRDDDDINDVASMAGVNLSEESARILATNSELVGAVMRSCKDEAFLSASMLQHKILEIGQRFGVTELGPEVVNIVSHATQQRLQNLLEKVSLIAQQKNMTYKEDSRYEQVDDVRSQLKFLEQLDQLEKQKKEEQEREILMKAAKSRSRQEDPEQLRLKQKAKEMQQQELAQIRQRDANLTALAAIGPRKKRKLDSPSLGTDTEGPGLSASASGGLNAGASRQYTRQRITRVNLRDLLFCLENESSTSHSQLLYRALLK